jgi:hypothetical protein
MASQAITNIGLFVRLEAKTGREEDVENLLKKALQMVDEPQTTSTRSPTTPVVKAHLQDAVASALKEKGPELLAEDPAFAAAQ